jgi:hypothetical protein
MAANYSQLCSICMYILQFMFPPFSWYQLSAAQTLHTVLAKLPSSAPNTLNSKQRHRLAGMENGFPNHHDSHVQEAVGNAEPPTYEEAFPPLGSPTLPGADPTFPSGTGAASYGRGTQSAWPVKSIPSSSVTQVKLLWNLTDFTSCCWLSACSRGLVLWCVLVKVLYGHLPLGLFYRVLAIKV